MSNHVHIAIQSSEASLGRFMGEIASQYARSTNKKLHRSGHLFERRYFSILVDVDEYVKELVRYIHCNPLRANLVEDLSEYSWSSHHAYLNGAGPTWLTTDWMLSMFGNTIGRARQAYKRFLARPGDLETWEKFRAGGQEDSRVLDEDSFCAKPNEDRAEPTSSDFEAIIRGVCESYGVTEEALASASRLRRHAAIRAEIGLAAVDAGVATLADVARRFRRSQSAMCRAINGLRRRNANK